MTWRVVVRGSGPDWLCCIVSVRVTKTVDTPFCAEGGFADAELIEISSSATYAAREHCTMKVAIEFAFVEEAVYW